MFGECADGTNVSGASNDPEEPPPLMDFEGTYSACNALFSYSFLVGLVVRQL